MVKFPAETTPLRLTAGESDPVSSKVSIDRCGGRVEISETGVGHSEIGLAGDDFAGLGEQVAASGLSEPTESDCPDSHTGRSRNRKRHFEAGE
jgi:hypothetical protein